LAATFVGVGHLRTAVWVRPSLFVLGARFEMPWTMGFSAGTLASRASSRGTDRSVQLHLRDQHGTQAFLPAAARMLCPSGPNPAVRPEGRTWLEAALPPVRFCTPLTTSPAESGYPGITTPGTFRTWACSTLLRFAPLLGLPALFHAGAASGVQRTGRVPPIFPHGHSPLPEGD